MASNIFPMLSSTPPPIDDCPDDDDDDDEFGNFASANIPFDSSFDSPVKVEKHKPYKSAKNGISFPDEIKFNCIRSTPPSSEEHTPKFTEENEVLKFNFVPIEKDSNHLCNETIASTKDFVDSECKTLDATSQQVPPLQTMYNNSEISSLNSDIHDNFSINSSSEIENASNNVTDKEINSFKESSIAFCDLSNKSTLGTCKNDENCFTNNCDEYQINASSLEEESSTESSFLFTSDKNDSAKLNSQFNYESNDSTFCDFQHCNQEVSLSEKDTNFQFSVNKCSEENDEASFVFNELNFTKEDDFSKSSDNEYDDFQSCVKNVSLDNKNSESNVVNFKKDSDSGSLGFQQSSVTEDVADYQSVSDQVDDFADFQDFNQTDLSTDDFADFSSAPFDSNKLSEPSEYSEFTDFEGASCNVPSENTPCLTSQKNTDALSTVITAIFPPSDYLKEDDSPNEASPQILEQSNKSRRLWEKLHEVEQTPSLRFQWGISHSFQQLLRSINVDYHSILRTSSVPIFASGLSLLEPVKGVSNSVNHDSEDRSNTPKGPIPPVEFDWTSSGLVNPLDFGPASSTLMDLSFLSSMETETKASKKDHSFENELLKPSPAPCLESTSKTHILEQLLSKNVSSIPNSKTSHRPPELSEEAVRVLDQLPDLSFMQAKVLMFPISKT